MKTTYVAVAAAACLAAGLARADQNGAPRPGPETKKLEVFAASGRANPS